MWLSALVLFSIDIILMGSGKWSDYFGFPFRKVFFIIICAYSAWFWLSRGLATARELQAISCLAILLMLWGLLLPALYETNLSFALGDSLPLYGLLFAPAINCVISKNGLWNDSRNFIYWLARLLAVAHVTIATLGILFRDQAEIITVFVNYVLDPVEGGIVGINFEPDTFRIMYGSSLFLLLGFYICMDRLRTSSKISNILNAVLFLAAIAATTTRSFYLAVVLSWCIYFCFRLVPLKFRLSIGFFLTMGAILALLTVPIVLMADPSFVAQLGLLSRPESDAQRYLQSVGLLASLADNILIGKGFGAQTDLTSQAIAPYSFELSILAYDMKVGIIGLVVTVLIFALYARTAQLSTLAQVGKERFAVWFAAIFVTIFISNTNPYLFSFLGFYLLMFFYLELRSFYSVRCGLVNYDSPISGRIAQPKP